MQKEQHIYVFEERKELWCYLIRERATAFRDLLLNGIKTFCSLYVSECSKGAERHIRLLLAWNNYCGSYAVNSQSTDTSRKQWINLTNGYSGNISDDCRSAVVSAIFAALFTCIVQQRNMILDKLRTRCESGINQDPSMPVTPDDNATLYRLFGFSLHVCIRLSTRSCWSCSRMAKHYTLKKKLKFRKQLSLLKLLVETDKTVIPAILKQTRQSFLLF